MGRNCPAVLESILIKEEKIKAGIVMRTANCCKTGLFPAEMKLPVLAIIPNRIGRNMDVKAVIMELIASIQ